MKRIAEEPFDDSDSSEDYEGQLLAAPVPSSRMRSSASSNLYDAELRKPGSNLGGSEDEGGEAAEGFLDEDEDDLMQGFDVSGDKETLIRDRIAQSQEQMKHLLAMFDDDQLRRYETFRRVGFPRQAIKKLMVRVLEQPQVAQNSVIVVAGIAKVWVGEVVEEGRRVMEELGETGPIQPAHLLEAQRRIKAAGLSPSSSLHRRTNRLL